jgi:hypothetical protein
MIYDWYKLFNKTEWLASGLVQRSVLVQLEDRGRVQYSISQGNTTAVLYGDAFLPAELLAYNPYVQETVAVYLDANNDVWLGFEVEE